VTNVLMVTTTMRMLDWVHGDTSDARPVALLGVGSVVRGVGAEHWLVGTLSTSNDANHSSAATHHGLTDARGHSDTGLSSVLGVADDDSGGAGGTGENATVSELGLNVGDNGTLGHGINWEDVANSEGGFGTAIDEHSGVHALDSDEKLSVLLEFVLVSETDFSERCASARVVNDVLNDALDVSLALSEVKSSESGWGHSLGGVRLEDRAATTSLCSDYSSHD